MEFKHTSVLLSETIENLRINPDGIYVDGTLGGAGHSEQIAKRLSGKGRLIGLDQDAAAIAASTQRLKGFEDRVTILRSNFRSIPEELEKLGIERVDGVLLDLGVSSYQLDDADRGFTYRTDAPLDMRMDLREGISAADVVNTYEEKRLFKVISDYGEERFAGNIARGICRRRQEKPILTTGELVRVIEESIPAKMRYGPSHPAKRTFQAIRIEVNGELKVLEETLEKLPDCLADGGRLCIITFHSLEDRIVKNRFRTWEHPCVCPPDFPVCTCGRLPKGAVITKRPIVPTEDEKRENNRSHSAKLRVFERRFDKARI